MMKQKILKLKTFPKRLWYEFKIWKIDNEAYKLTMNIQTGLITYKKFCHEIELLKWKKNQLITKLNFFK